VKRGKASLARTKAVLGCMNLLAFACSLAQLPATVPETFQASSPTPLLLAPLSVKTVPLVSDLCPAVGPGDRVTLDWNPGFDRTWAVTGLRHFTLRFAALDQYGLHLLPGHSLAVTTLHVPHGATAIYNGYYHLEMAVPPNAHPGTYRLTRADAVARTVPEYAGLPLQMTNSPADRRFCITVLRSPPAPSPSPSP